MRQPYSVMERTRIPCAVGWWGTSPPLVVVRTTVRILIANYIEALTCLQTINLIFNELQLVSLFYNWGTRAQRGETTCCRSHVWLVVKSALESGSWIHAVSHEASLPPELECGAAGDDVETAGIGMQRGGSLPHCPPVGTVSPPWWYSSFNWITGLTGSSLILPD